MEIKLYNTIINEMNNLGLIDGTNIDDYLSLSNELLENLEKIKQLDIQKLYNNKTIDNYNIILSEVSSYIKNKQFIINLNEYITYKQKELSYTLQYQRNKKLKLELKKKKSIYLNK